MLKKLTILILCGFLAMLFLPFKAKASHAAGAEITYQWISGSTYKIIYKFYRDCSGIAEPATVQCCYYATCGGPVYTLTLNKAPGVNGLEVGTGCPGFNSTCNGGSNPGYKEWIYENTVTLPSQCNFWRFYVVISARNNSHNLLNPQQNQYVETTFDNQAAQGNSSPFFTIKPLNYMCVNSPYSYNNGAVDPNGDSLSYELIMPLTQPNTACVVGTVGISMTFHPTNFTPPAYNLLTNPLQTNNTFNLNATTGQMTFTPSVQQIATITVLVREWRNGVQIGSIMRDMQYIVLPCNGVQPSLSTDSLSLSGVQMVNGQVQGCATELMQFCFDVTSSAVNPVLVASDNHAIVAPGSTVTYIGQATDTVRGCFSWTPGVADTGLTVLAITVKDSTCLPPGIILSQTFTIPIYIWPPTKARTDTLVCPYDTVQLSVHGGTSFDWTVLPGGSPISSLSCTNCQFPVAVPSTSTYYVVTSTGANAFCLHNKDTVYVEVAIPPVISLGPDITTCIGETIQLNVNFVPDPNTTYNFNWLPGTYLNSATIQNPTSKPTANITYEVVVTPNNAAICASRDTLNVLVLQGYTIYNHDTAVCIGNGVQINAMGSTQYTYTWTPALGVSDPALLNPYITPPSTGQYAYTLTATYPGCKDSTHIINIDVQPIPTVSVGPDQILCYGDTLYMNPVISPSYPLYNFNWAPAGGFSNNQIQSPYYTGYQTATISLTVTTSAGCIGNDDAFYEVITPDIIDVSNDVNLCPGDTTQLHVTGTAVTVAWTPNLYMDDSTSFDPKVWPITTTTYLVYARDINYCLEIEKVKVIIAPSGVIHLTDSVTIYPGETYQIDPKGNCLYFQWFPPYGLSASNIANPIASPEVSTRYYVTASTEAGCLASDSIDVKVSLDSYINVPNAFTPGSSPNSTIKVVRNGFATLKSFRIFNRWGTIVFESSNIDEGWDGTFNGKPQPMGVYVYTVEAVTKAGRKFSKQGNITLIR